MVLKVLKVISSQSRILSLVPLPLVLLLNLFNANHPSGFPGE